MEIIRRSYLNDFERCPRRFQYLVEEGITLREQFQSLSLRMGSYLHTLISGTDTPIYFSPDEQREKGVVEAIYSAMQELDIIPKNLEHEVTFQKKVTSTVLVEGTLDMVRDDWFGEIKLTAKPEYYLHTFSAQAQLEFYFFVSELSSASMLPVRMPAIRFMETKETPESYIGRVKEDILRRPSHYFPYYNPEVKDPKWGVKFFATEFDLKETVKRLKWQYKEIKECRKHGYFPQRKQNCLFPGECEFMNLCEAGAFNETVYERKEEGKNDNKKARS